MARMRVAVCLPPGSAKELNSAIEEALAPFEMYSNIEWREIWDWWTIRGGSDGTGFSVLREFEGSPILIHDSPRYDGESLPSLPGKCAGGPRGMLTLSGERRSWQSDLLTLDGWWIENENPVHGTCDGQLACAHMRDGWRYAEDPVAYLESLDPEVILVKLLCHG